jgi:ketosteroid isomerase-like protein
MFQRDIKMESTEAANLALVREYLTALERGVTGDALARFFTPDALQEELPNRLNPHGARSDLPTLLERAERGQHLLESQQYKIRSELAQGDAVAVEAEWSATLAMQVGTIPAGGQMRAFFAMFFKCSNGRIQRQRNYDCFEAW